MMDRIARNAVLITCFVALGHTAFGQPVTICWTGAEDGDWADVDNWDNCSGQPASRTPTSIDTAIIKGDASLPCVAGVNGNTYAVGTLIVEGSETIFLQIGPGTGPDDEELDKLNVHDHMEVQEDGLVRIRSFAQLELSGTADSQVDGTVVFWHDTETAEVSCNDDPFGIILVSDTSRIEGNGGEILGRKCEGESGPIPGFIRTTLGERLTVASDGGEFKIHGYIDVQALMTNESAAVGTDEEDDVMRLSTQSKDGDEGRWFCHDGDLHVDAIEVTGENTWDMIGAVSTANLFFEEGCTCNCLAGDFDIRGGTVHLKDDVCTTGTTRVKSVGLSAPSVINYANVNSAFAGTCAGCGS